MCVCVLCVCVCVLRVCVLRVCVILLYCSVQGVLSQTSLELLDDGQQVNNDNNKSTTGPDVDLIAVLANQVVNETNRRRHGGGAKRRIANKQKKTSNDIPTCTCINRLLLL